MNNYQQYIKGKPCFYTIDPGCRSNGGTGLCRFDQNKLEHITLVDSPLKEWNKASDMICHTLNEFFDCQIDACDQNIPVFIEKPQYFDNFKGRTTAKSDSLEKLITLYGRIYQIVCQNGFRPIPVIIQDWKKGMTKEVVIKRFMRMFPDIVKRVNLTKFDNTKVDSDSFDALCMGLFILGEF